MLIELKPGHAFDHVLGGHLSLDLEKRISRPFGVFTAICAFHKISRNFTDFHGISRPFAGISRSFHEISRFFTAMSGRTPLSRPLGGFTAISPCGTRPPKTRSYACLGTTLGILSAMLSFNLAANKTKQVF